MKTTKAGAIIRKFMHVRPNRVIGVHKRGTKTFRDSMRGSEMIDWLIELSSSSNSGIGGCLASGGINNNNPLSRIQARGYWQALHDSALIAHVEHEHPFLDSGDLLYRWCDESDEELGFHQAERHRHHRMYASYHEDAEGVLNADMEWALGHLSTVGGDALFRVLLRKPWNERTAEELDVIYAELVDIKALSHLSTMLKRQLASVITIEIYPFAGSVLFRQGEEGKSWYVILKGAVDVLIYGKGVVCSLEEGDDFGKLALVNDAPRAATIVTSQDNSQFLRVDKENFNRILRDVEANTVRLKEHGEDVLVLEKIPVRNPPSVPPTTPALPPQPHRYSVMAGKAEKMMEYILETRTESYEQKHHDFKLDGGKSTQSHSSACASSHSSDTFLEDFLLTHPLFIPSSPMCNYLITYFHQKNAALTNKKRVINFVKAWVATVGLTFFQDPVANAFLEELYSLVTLDSSVSATTMKQNGIRELMGLRESAMRMTTRPPRLVIDSHVITNNSLSPLQQSIASFDQCILRVYNIDGSFMAVRAAMDKTAGDIIDMILAKQSMQKQHLTTSPSVVIHHPTDDDIYNDPTDLTLVELKSSGVAIGNLLCLPSFGPNLSPVCGCGPAFNNQSRQVMPPRRGNNQSSSTFTMASPRSSPSAAAAGGSGGGGGRRWMNNNSNPASTGNTNNQSASNHRNFGNNPRASSTATVEINDSSISTTAANDQPILQRLQAANRSIFLCHLLVPALIIHNCQGQQQLRPVFVGCRLQLIFQSTPALLPP